jgi:hypothetical protein
VTNTVETEQAVHGLPHFVKLARTGLDEEARGFDPSFCCEPIKDVLRCLMVQVPQIVVYAPARLVQWNAGGSQLALFAFQSADRVNGAARLRPQTKAICALCRQAGGGKAWPNFVSEITKRLFHPSANLNGGWIDPLHENDASMVDYMPANMPAPHGWRRFGQEAGTRRRPRQNLDSD